MSGFYTFRWNRPANEVVVTGTFDNWARSIRLDRDGDGFSKKIELPVERILYKFIVDGTWVVDPSAPIETESSGIQNSVLYPSQFEEYRPSAMSQANINTVAPDSSTVPLAANVPKENQAGSGDLQNALISSAAPDSSTAALAANVPKENKAGGGDLQNATISSAAPDSSTAALAANVPKENQVNSQNAIISSAAPDSSTAALAADVPLERPTPAAGSVPGFFPETPASERDNFTQQQEPQQFSVNPLPASDTPENPIHLRPGEPVPKDVSSQTITSNVKLDKESYEKGATNFPVGGQDVEGGRISDLPPVVKNMIPESSLPIVGGGSKDKDTEGGAKVPEASAAGSTAPGSSTITGTAKAAYSSVASTVGGIAAAAGFGSAASKEQPAPTVPEAVKDSIAKADASPEAAAVPETVEAKKEVESELKHEVQPVPAADTSKVSGSENPVTLKPADGVPAPVKESIAEAKASPEAAAHTTSVENKKAAETELKKEVAPAQPAVSGSNGAANGSSAATGTANGTAVPTKTTEVASGANNGPAKSPEVSPDGKKAKRRSFIARIKDKFHRSHKHGAA